MLRLSLALLALALCFGCGSQPPPEPVAQRPIPSPAASRARSANSPAPQSATAQQPVGSIQARAALAPGPAEPPKPPIPHEAVAKIPGALHILSAVASPTSDDIFVLAKTTRDTYGGTFFVVRFAGSAATIQTVVEGTNAEYFDAGVWSPDGATAYFTFDSGYSSYGGENKASRGLFAWDRATGKVSQVLSDAIGGLAISDDGKLVGFWDYTAGDKLTVYNLSARQVVRSWGGQTHSADDLVINDLLFTPGGKSLLARLYVPREDPVMEYEIPSGKMGPFAENTRAMAAAGDGIYFLQFAMDQATSREQPHRLMQWKDETAKPVAVLEDFPYLLLSGSHRSPWLLAGTAGGYTTGTAVYDTRTGQIQTAGKSCSAAVVTASGRILYVFGNEFVADAAVCNGPPPLSQPNVD